MAKSFSLIPEWVRNYQRSDFRFDFWAGLTVGVMLIPQGMAYALLAGLPPVYGLYASTIPLFIYAFFGTSRHLSVGPVAIDSMLTAAGVSLLAQAGSEDYIAMAITLAFMVGLIQFGLGIFKLGFLVQFLSHPVIVGFTSAAAIIIAFSQLKHLLGIDLSTGQQFQEIVKSLFTRIEETHMITLLIGLCGILFLEILRKYYPLFPAPLIIVFFSLLVVWFFRLDLFGVKIVGAIPTGLPSPSLPFASFDVLERLLPTAFAIALVSFMESTAVARSIQQKHKTYRVHTNKDLLAIGLSNIGGSFFRAFPVSGGFSRSAVNDEAGARSGMSSIVSGLLILATLLFLTPLFYYLPNAILSSIILVAVIRLIRIKDAKYLWAVDKKDFGMMIVTFLGTLTLGIGTGIGIGVGLSLAWIIFEASYPHHAELGRVPGTNTFRNIRRFKELEVEDDILIFRYDAPLFFGNSERFRQLILDYITNRPTKVKAIIVDMDSINSVDASAILVLEDTVSELQKEGIRLLLAEVKGPVRDKFHRSGLTTKFGEGAFFITVEDAIRSVMDGTPGYDPLFTLQTNIRN